MADTLRIERTRLSDLQGGCSSSIDILIGLLPIQSAKHLETNDSEQQHDCFRRTMHGGRIVCVTYFDERVGPMYRRLTKPSIPHAPAAMSELLYLEKPWKRVDDVFQSQQKYVQDETEELCVKSYRPAPSRRK